MKRLAVLLVVIFTITGGLVAQGAKNQGTINVLGVWGGQEADAFAAMTQVFTDRTGIKVQFEATRDLDAVLTTRVQAGNPPDVVILPNPGKLYELRREPES